MERDVAKAITGLVESQRDLVKLCKEAKIESAALQAVCGALAAQIALLDKEPRERLNAILGGIEGAAAAVAANSESLHLSATIDNICTAAESLMPSA